MCSNFVGGVLTKFNSEYLCIKQKQNYEQRNEKIY